MRSKLIWLLAACLVMVLSGCCLRFSNLTAGQRYAVGESIHLDGTKILVEKFQWSSGNWTSSGRAMVDTRSYSGGSGYDLNANNVNLNIQFDYPLHEITFKFGELGGNNNVRINGDFRNVENLVDLNGAAIGGVQLTVNATQQGNNWHGTITLEGDIREFVIGGQELWLDDICPCKK